MEKDTILSQEQMRQKVGEVLWEQVEYLRDWNKGHKISRPEQVVENSKTIISLCEALKNFKFFF